MKVLFEEDAPTITVEKSKVSGLTANDAGVIPVTEIPFEVELVLTLEAHETERFDSFAPALAGFATISTEQLPPEVNVEQPAVFDNVKLVVSLIETEHEVAESGPVLLIVTDVIPVFEPICTAPKAIVPELNEIIGPAFPITVIASAEVLAEYPREQEAESVVVFTPPEVGFATRLTEHELFAAMVLQFDALDRVKFVESETLTVHSVAPVIAEFEIVNV